MKLDLQKESNNLLNQKKLIRINYIKILDNV